MSQEGPVWRRSARRFYRARDERDGRDGRETKMKMKMEMKMKGGGD